MKQYLVVVALTAIAILLGYTNVKTAIKARQKSAQVNELQKKLADCTNAKVARDTVYIIKHVDVPRIVTVQATDSIILSDTVKIQPVMRYYQDSVAMADLTLYYKMQTLGSLKWVKFNYDLRQPIVTESNIIYRDSITVQRIKPTFTAYLFAEAGLTSPAISVGAMATFKGIGGTYRYDITNSTHNAGLVLKLK